MAAHELPECRALAVDLHRELNKVIPSFVKRAMDERYGAPAVARISRIRDRAAALARRAAVAEQGPSVRLVEHDPHAERKVVAAALFAHSNLSLDEQPAPADASLEAMLEAMLGDRSNRRQRVPRAFEHAEYTLSLIHI